MFREFKVIKDAPRGFKISLIEGGLTALGSSFIGPMVTPLLIRLGADASLLGIYIAIATASTPPLQVASALLLDRFRERRLELMTIFSALNRAIWILVLLVILGLWGDVWTVIALLILLRVFGTVAGLAWTDIMADLSELSLRGRLFALRNSILGIVSIISLAFAKFIYDTYSYPTGYIYAFSIGTAFMLASTPLLYLYGDPVRPKGVGISLRTFLDIIKDREVLKDTLAMSFWNSSVNLVSAVWVYHMFVAFNADETWFTTLNLVGSVTRIAANFPWGRIYDRFGPRRVFLLSGLGIIAVPVLFPLLPNLEGQLVLQVYSSFAWTGFGLASFNYAISYSATLRHVYIAMYNSIPAIASSVASILGSFLYQELGVAVFYISAICRVLAAIVLYKYASERGVTYEELKFLAHLYPLLVVGRGIVANVYVEAVYTLKVIYSLIATTILLAMLISVYIIVLRLFMR
ncbi:MAG: hypothetical protein DRJ51_04115 [Thermoprotei archaeon]|nr:MAG: hypothetical protein DRJ51_04115 [Thermoprotei archaeon]